MEILSRLAFYQYLETLPRDEPFAEACIPGCCPIARYLSDQGAPLPVVSDTEYAEDATGQWYPLPEWARQFVQTIDAKVDVTDGPASLAITPMQAIRALNDVPRWWHTPQEARS